MTTTDKEPSNLEVQTKRAREICGCHNCYVSIGLNNGWTHERHTPKAPTSCLANTLLVMLIGGQMYDTLSRFFGINDTKSTDQGSREQ